MARLLCLLLVVGLLHLVTRVTWAAGQLQYRQYNYYCVKGGCKVRRDMECCRHPICAQRRPRICQGYIYGNWDNYEAPKCWKEVCLTGGCTSLGEPLSSDILAHRCRDCLIELDPVCCLHSQCLNKEATKCEVIHASLFTPYSGSRKLPKNSDMMIENSNANMTRSLTRGKCRSSANSSDCNYCIKPSTYCPVVKDPGCCLHPTCKTRRAQKCVWTDGL